MVCRRLRNVEICDDCFSRLKQPTSIYVAAVIPSFSKYYSCSCVWLFLRYLCTFPQPPHHCCVLLHSQNLTTEQGLRLFVVIYFSKSCIYMGGHINAPTLPTFSRSIKSFRGLFVPINQYNKPSSYHEQPREHNGVVLCLSCGPG